MTALRSLILIVALSALVAVPETFAAEIMSRWVGGASGRWAVPSNWSPAVVPNNGADTYHVVIDGDDNQNVEVILDIAPINIQTLTIDAGDTLSIRPVGSLNIHGGAVQLDGLIELNPMNASGLARLIFPEDCIMLGEGEVNMLGQPGRCELRIGSGNTLTLGEPGLDPTMPPRRPTIRGRGVLSGGALRNHASILGDFVNDDLVLSFVAIINDGSLGTGSGDISLGTSVTVTGSGVIEDTGGGQGVVGMSGSVVDGTDGLIVQDANLQLFGDATVRNTVLNRTTVGINNASTLTLENVRTDQFSIDGNLTGTANIFGSSVFINTTANDVIINGDVNGDAVINGVDFSQVTLNGGDGQDNFTIISNGDNTIADSSVNGADFTLMPGDNLIVTNVESSNSTFQGDVVSQDDRITVRSVNSFTNARISDVRVFADEDGQVVATFTLFDNVYISKDEGRTWILVSEDDNTISNSTTEGIVINVLDDSNLTMSNANIVNSVIQGDTGSQTDRVALLGTNLLDQGRIEGVHVFGDPNGQMTVVASAINGTYMSTDQGNTWTLVSLAGSATNSTTLENMSVDVSGDWTISDSTLIDVSGDVQDGSTITINNVFFDTTTFTGFGSAAMQAQALARIDNGTFTNIDIFFSGEPFLLTANGFVLLRDLEVRIEDATTVRTDTTATLNVANSAINGADSSAELTFEERLSMEVQEGLQMGTMRWVTNPFSGAVELERDSDFTAQDLIATLTAISISGRFAVETGFEPSQMGFFLAYMYADASVLVDGNPSPLGAASTLEVSGSWSFEMIDEARWSWGPDSVLAMTGGVGAQVGDWEDWTRLEVGGTDLGTDSNHHQGDPAGFDMNFDLSILRIGPGAHAYLEDLIDNGNRNGPFGAGEALYVDTLEFADPDGQLNLNGIHLYYESLVGDPSQIIDVPVETGGGEVATLTNLQIVKGTMLDGGLGDLMVSDDSYVHTRSGFGGTFIDLHHMEMQIDAMTNVQSPTSIDLTIESRIDEPSGIEQIRVFNHTTGAFDLIRQHAIGSTDTREVIADIDATQYAGPTGVIKVRIKHIVFVPFLAFTFQSFVDLVEIAVE